MTLSTQERRSLQLFLTILMLQVCNDTYELLLDFQPEYRSQVQVNLIRVIEDKEGFAVSLSGLIAALHSPLDEFVTKYAIDFEALEQHPYDLPYDELLAQYSGALHGLYAWLQQGQCDGFFSPGQVLDVNSCLHLCGMAITPEISQHHRALFDQVQALFGQAAMRQDPIRYELEASL